MSSRKKSEVPAAKPKTTVKKTVKKIEKKPIKKTAKAPVEKTVKKPAKKPVKKTVKAQTTNEQKSRAQALVSGVHTLHNEALELAESVLFMADKLKEARVTMKNEPLVIDYDNGGGQTGIRENPHFVAFEHLMASYTKSLKQLTEIVEAGAPVRQASSIMAELTTIAGRKLG